MNAMPPVTGSSDYAGKRAFDIVVATVVLILFSPVLLVGAIAVAVSSRGPVLYTAVRVGRHGELIQVHKLRSMRHAAAGPTVTSAHDPRVTAVGKILRSTKVDEIPQLFDVITGSMSLVGPRPEDPTYVADYDDQQRAILSWRPGITSPASIRYRHEEQLLAQSTDVDATYRAASRDKIAIDLEYFRGASLRSDVGVLARTVVAVLDRTPDHATSAQVAS